jgi:hypothetical protein
MKIDVEGMEPDVLRSWGDSSRRPWLLVIEATYPTSQESTRDLWINEVVRRGYEQVFFDGLSCYFIHEQHRSLAARFDCPANVFDGFIIAPPHFAAARIRGELEAGQRAQSDLQAEVFQVRRALEQDRRELASTCERLVSAEQVHRDFRQEAEQREIQLEGQIREAKTEAAAARVDVARFEERGVQVEDKLRRSDARVAEQEQHLSDIRARLANAVGALAQADTLIRAAAAERPGRWQRFGEGLGIARRPRSLQALAGWSGVQAQFPQDGPPAMQAIPQGTQPIMSSSATNGARNPYLRANSLAELLSWHDLDFVRCAYVTVLGRQPDSTGEHYYVDRLRRGYSKYGILWQLRTSSEGPRHDPGISGFDKALRKHRHARNRLYGWLVRWFRDYEADTRIERRVRVVENLVGALPQSFVPPDLRPAIQQAVAAEMSDLSQVVRAAVKSARAGEGTPDVPPDYDAVRGRLSPNGQKIYDRIYKQ